MNTLLLALTLAASLATPAALRPAPHGVGARTVAPKPAAQQKVWLSEDVEALRDRGLISIIGEELIEEPAAVEETVPTPLLPKELDPEWYFERLAEPRAELARVEEKLASLRRNLACACTPEAGLNVDRPSAGITPESGLWLLERHVRELHSEIAAIEDEALRRGLAPGIFR